MSQSTHKPSNLRSIVTKYKNDAMAVLMGRSELSKHPSLFNELYSYYLDYGIMPYGVAKARTGCPYTWIEEQLDNDLLDNEGKIDFKAMPWEVKPKFKTKAEELFGESNTDVGW